MSTAPTIDARAVHKADIEGPSLVPGDYAVLALLGANDRAAVKSVNKAQKLMYIAQVGGLHNHRREPDIEYLALPEYFTFSSSSYGPRSEELTDSLDKLSELGLVDVTKHNTPTESIRKEYVLNDTGADILNDAFSIIGIDKLRTLKLVKTIYNNVPALELADITGTDYDFRKLNDKP